MPADIPSYRIWGANGQAEQPIELPALVSAIKGQRVRANSWIYLVHDGAWRRASEVTELKMFFKDSKATASAPPSPLLRTGVLRRMKVFAAMDEAQLQVFVGFMEVLNVRQFAQVVHKGENGDAMFLVLEGELRAVAVIDGKESTLSTVPVGEAFGEIAVLDQGPRSADVVANVDSVLLKITATSLDRLQVEAPQAAAPFLFALGKAVASRLRAMTRRFEDSVQLSRAAKNIE